MSQLMIGSRAAALGASLWLAGCAPHALAPRSPSALGCARLEVIFGPSGQYWGTSCGGDFMTAIAMQIAHDFPRAASPLVADSDPFACSPRDAVPVPFLEGSAWTCPRFLRSAAKVANMDVGKKYRLPRPEAGL
jgi:hypothetical protein